MSTWRENKNGNAYFSNLGQPTQRKKKSEKWVIKIWILFARMRFGSKDDKDVFCKILADSFLDNPSVNYATKSGRNKYKYVLALMEYSFEVCLRTGAVIIDDDNIACALIKFSDKKLDFLSQCLLDLRLLFKSIGLKKMAKVLQRESIIKSFYKHEKYLYIWFIGVNPNMQGKGHGSRLLKDILSLAKAHHLPVYLETSVKENVDWYRKFGFEINETANFTVPLFSLVNKESIQ